MKEFIIILIRFYKKIISPIFPSSCRFYPSCSSYAIESIEKFGIFAGVWLAMKRILKCHPFHSGGFDPVPDDINIKHFHKH